MFSENKRATSAEMGVHVEQEWMFRLDGNMQIFIRADLAGSPI